MTSTPETAPSEGAVEAEVEDVVLPPIDESTARELALAALTEITPAATIGDPAESTVHDDGVLTLRFQNKLSGYPGWLWTVSLAQVEGSAPTVLEVELIPGDGALIAPDWLPWAERLAEYQATQAALAAEGLATEDPAAGDEDEELDDVDDLDAADFDDDGSPILHSGDVDGVDIDELAEDAEESDEDEDSDEDESADDEGDDDASDEGEDADEDDESDDDDSGDDAHDEDESDDEDGDSDDEEDESDDDDSDEDDSDEGDESDDDDDSDEYAGYGDDFDDDGDDSDQDDDGDQDNDDDDDKDSDDDWGDDSDEDDSDDEIRDIDEDRSY